jgi:hypothetical protein
MIHLALREHALFNQQLTNWNTLHGEPPENISSNPFYWCYRVEAVRDEALRATDARRFQIRQAGC